MTQKLATQVVRDFLAAMEARDIAKARNLLSPGFAMIFPGNNRFVQLEEMIAWAAPRYRWVAKRYDRFDEAPGDGETIVYCYGTLYGEWPDGTPFEGIRFIDRFIVRDGKLAEQLVWNDMAEVKAETGQGMPA